jgi:polyphosphate kinase
MSCRLFFNRNISWFFFNQSVLAGAIRQSVPLMERFYFLPVYSFNPDKLYRNACPQIHKLLLYVATKLPMVFSQKISSQLNIK